MLFAFLSLASASTLSCSTEMHREEGVFFNGIRVLYAVAMSWLFVLLLQPNCMTINMQVMYVCACPDGHFRRERPGKTSVFHTLVA
ncbi:hypothetical protein BKA57DRAFT_445359 [Linnemannia elongata]|nr:hypothetical protein BKA57DRAFT_445359 [Linnemannia elongata]